MNLSAAQLFDESRTHGAWQDRAVPDALLRELYERVKFGPTAANCTPLRIVFVRTSEAKARLVACMNEGNREKTASAPVTAILGMDLRFYEHFGQLFPHNPGARSWYEGNEQATRDNALRNSSLQGGYFILAARMLGLDCGPMGGFDAARVDAEFWRGTAVRTNFICNLGYGDASKLKPRLPRLSFEQACSLT